MGNKTILVAFGGVSPEHEVSVITGIQAATAIQKEPYQLIPLYITKSGKFLTGSQLLDLSSYENLQTLEKEATPCFFSVDETGRTVLAENKSAGLFSKPAKWPIDCVLVAFHGADGENGSFQGLCETYNLPYTGCGTFASALGMNKMASKRFAQSLGIEVTPDVYFTETTWIENKTEILKEIKELGDDIFIKPVHLGSSIGVKRVKNGHELEDAIEFCFRFDEHLIVEKAVSPLMEVNCSVLGDNRKCEASVCEQPIGNDELLSFEDKYLGSEGKGMASAGRIIPAPISDALRIKIQEASRLFFRNIDGSGVVRFDYLVNKETETFYFNEINTIPGSFSFYLWDKSGVDFTRLINKLIELAETKHRIKNGRVRSYETNLLSIKSVKGIKGLKGKA